MSKSKSSTLSKNLLQMKFMQRTKEKVENEIEDEKYNDFLTKSNLPENIKQSINYVVSDLSYAELEHLMFGRRSFKGMNSEIEMLMNNKKTDEQKEIEEADISIEEMVKRYEHFNENDSLIDECNHEPKRKKHRGKKFH